MNTIMRALQDDGQLNLKNSNYVPTNPAYFSEPQFNNNNNLVQHSTSNLGMQALF
jgi:hypothetical protein